MPQPYFSVVIPLYNKADHIAATLQSVLAQTLQDFEIVVVDDGSTDHGDEVVIALHNSRIRCVKQPNAGVSAARNRGVTAANGRFIAFLDADDLWFPWCLEEQARTIEQFPGMGLYSVGHEILQDGIRYVPSTGTITDYRGPVEDFLGAFSNGLALANSSTACIPRDVFIQSGGFPAGVTRGEDVYLWLKIGLAHGVAHSARICAQINRDAGNRSNRSTNPEVQYYLYYLDELLRENKLELRHIAGAKQLFRKAVIFSAAGFAQEGNRAALAAMRKIPTSRSDRIVRLALMLLVMTPPFVLRILKRFRHKRSMQ